MAETLKSLLTQRRLWVWLGVVGGVMLFAAGFWEELNAWASTVLALVFILLVLFIWGHHTLVLLLWTAAGLWRLVEIQLANPGQAGTWGRAVVLAYLAAFILFIIRPRRRRTLSVIMAGLFWLRLMLLNPPSTDSLQSGVTLAYALGGFALIFFGGLALIAQFVLPVQTLTERRRVIGRLLLYLFGRPGPALFVKRAQLVSSAGELQRPGPGLILVDPNSAVILEREPALGAPGQPRPQVRVAGPGLVFTEPDERLRADDILDLRRQTRAVGGVRGLTRDGLEVEAALRVTFRLAPPAEPDSAARHHPAYPFNPESAFRAVYGRAADSETAVRWTELPLVVAKQVYRDLLAQRRLDQPFQLYSPTVEDPLASFRNEFAAQMKTHPVLQERGIQVLSASVSQMTFPAQDGQGNSVERQRLLNWLAEWQSRELVIKAGMDLQAVRIRDEARIAAQKAWVKQLAEVMQMQGKGDEARQATALRLFQALEAAASDPSTRRLLPADAIRMLENIRKWLRFDGQAPAPPPAARRDGIHVEG
jgi:hypothetical protein